MATIERQKLPDIKAEVPHSTPMDGQTVQLRPLLASDASALYSTLGGAQHAKVWTFIPDGPYLDLPSFTSSISKKSQSTDPLFYAVRDQRTGDLVGHVTFMRIDLPNRVIEIGNLVFSDLVHRSRVTTETIYLMLRAVFEDLGFRRCEWKCDELNGPSKAAAMRFGFTFEGVFRQHFIVKGFNRDTAWFSILDGEWPKIKAGFERWLDDANFDADGRQVRSLAECRDAVEGV